MGVYHGVHARIERHRSKEGLHTALAIQFA